MPPESIQNAKRISSEQVYFFFLLLFFFSFFEMALGMGEGMYLVNECDQSTLCEFPK